MTFQKKKYWGDYFWTMGLAICVAGLIKIFDDSYALIIAGLIIAAIGSRIKFRK